MTAKKFVQKYYQYAKISESNTGISAVAVLSQAALESGWGKHAPGNMFFGVKDNDGINGNEQLLTTTEYSRRADLKFPEIISIKPVTKKGKKYFKYRVKDYFRKYDSPADSFTDHSNFFYKYKRYADALKVKDNAFRFFEKIAKAGYATDPNYAEKLKSIARIILKYIPNETQNKY